MKKVAIFLLILLISFLPVAGKSLHEFCAKKKQAEPCNVLLAAEPEGDLTPDPTTSLLTRFLYTF